MAWVIVISMVCIAHELPVRHRKRLGGNILSGYIKNFYCLIFVYSDWMELMGIFHLDFVLIMRKPFSRLPGESIVQGESLL